MSTPGPPKTPSAVVSPRSAQPPASPAATPPPPKTPSLPSSLSTPQGMTAGARRVSTGFTTSPSATSLTGRASVGGDLSAGRMSTFRSLRTMKTSPVVLDMGESVTRAGFASEPAPRHIIPTAWEYPDGTKAHGVLSRGLNNIKQKAWSRILNKFFTAIFYDYLQVNPKDRRVVLVENPFWPVAFKKAAVSVLFSLEVPGVLLLPSTHLPLFSVGGTHALHIDCGYGETRVQPIYEGYSAGDALSVCPLGMRDVASVFSEFVQKEGKAVDHDGKPSSAQVPWTAFSAQTWESVAARTAFVRAMPAAKLQQLQDQRQKFDEAEQKRISAATHLRRVSTSGPLLGAEPATDALASHGMPEKPAVPPIGNNPPPPTPISSTVLAAGQSASRRTSLNKAGAPPPPPTKETPLPSAVSLYLSASRQLTIPPSARYYACDVLFGENEEGFNIAHSALNSLLKLDGEVRVLVAQNILLSGGTVNLPGFARRLLDELNGALFLPKYSELRALHHRFRLFTVPQGLPSGNMAWVGASIVGSLDIDASRFLVRDRVEQRKQRVPDWSLNPVQSLFTELEEKGDEPQPSSSPVPTDPEDTTTY